MSSVQVRPMKMTVPVYPGGRLGAGLAVLRLSMAGATLTCARLADHGGPGQWLLAILCVSLALGVWTRWSALAGAVALMVLGLPTLAPQDLAIAGGMAALVLTGPGAYAIDARVWGLVSVRSRSSR